MDTNFIHIENETEFNKIRRNQKRLKTTVHILFTSLWDKYSQDLVEQLSCKQYKNPIYIVNSFDTPHSFVIFNTNKVPTLVTLSNDDVSINDYLPIIYSILEEESISNNS